MKIFFSSLWETFYPVSENLEIFDECKENKDKRHEWNLLKEAHRLKVKETMFECSSCKTARTASEKFQIDGLQQQEKFLLYAKKNIRIATLSLIFGGFGTFLVNLFELII